MAAVGVEEDPAVQAARILLSLRHRPLQRPPEWVPLSPGEASAASKVPEGWSKRRRSQRERLPGGWKAALTELKLGHVAFFAGSGSWSSGEEPPRARERSRPRPAAVDSPMAARRPETPLYHVSPAGSGPWTSAADRAGPRPCHSGEKKSAAAAQQQAAEKAPAAAPVKEPMSASSPETPLDFGAAAAGSNASSSGDDAARPPPKRTGPGSGGASCGDDEGCSSPAKRPRAADAGGKVAADAAEEKAISAEPKTQSEPSTNGDDEGVIKFKFDLNLPWPDECPDMY